MVYRSAPGDLANADSLARARAGLRVLARAWVAVAIAAGLQQLMWHIAHAMGPSTVIPNWLAMGIECTRALLPMAVAAGAVLAARGVGRMRAVLAVLGAAALVVAAVVHFVADCRLPWSVEASAAPDALASAYRLFVISDVLEGTGFVLAAALVVSLADRLRVGSMLAPLISAATLVAATSLVNYQKKNSDVLLFGPPEEPWVHHALALAVVLLPPVLAAWAAFAVARSPASPVEAAREEHPGEAGSGHEDELVPTELVVWFPLYRATFISEISLAAMASVATVAAAGERPGRRFEVVIAVLVTAAVFHVVSYAWSYVRSAKMERLPSIVFAIGALVRVLGFAMEYSWFRETTRFAMYDGWGPKGSSARELSELLVLAGTGIVLLAHAVLVVGARRRLGFMPHWNELFRPTFGGIALLVALPWMAAEVGDAHTSTGRYLAGVAVVILAMLGVGAVVVYARAARVIDRALDRLAAERPATPRDRG